MIISIWELYTGVTCLKITFLWKPRGNRNVTFLWNNPAQYLDKQARKFSRLQASVKLWCFSVVEWIWYRRHRDTRENRRDLAKYATVSWCHSSWSCSLDSHWPWSRMKMQISVVGFFLSGSHCFLETETSNWQPLWRWLLQGVWFSVYWWFSTSLLSALFSFTGFPCLFYTKQYMLFCIFWVI